MIDIDGIFLVYKEKGITSQRVVSMIKRKFGIKKAGHTGTLDPMAEGLLPVMTGNATKFSQYLLLADKCYTATFVLGITTDTLDISGNILTKNKVNITKNQVIDVLKCFEGDILQTPPMYSAIKMGGRKLYELAREGKQIEREKRQVTIKSIELLNSDESKNEYTISVHCSKGTYIRTLCDDIGKKLGCGAVMTALIRTKTGSFDVKNAKFTNDLTENDIILVDKCLSNLKKVIIDDDFYLKLIKNGEKVMLYKLKLELCKEIYRIYNKNEVFIGTGTVFEKEDGPAFGLLRGFEDINANN